MCVGSELVQFHAERPKYLPSKPVGLLMMTFRLSIHSSRQKVMICFHIALSLEALPGNVHYNVQLTFGYALGECC